MSEQPESSEQVRATRDKERRRLYLRVAAKLLGWVAILWIIYVFIS